MQPGIEDNIMLIVGSEAMFAHKELNFGTRRKNPGDRDYICTREEWEQQREYYSNLGAFTELNGNKGHIKYFKFHMEYEIAEKGTSADIIIKLCNGMTVAPINMLYLLKMSHRYKKNSKHFLKTMEDIKLLRKAGAYIPKGWEELLKMRERETYNYGHPKLNVKSKDFFSGDGVKYVLEHDSIHEAIAVIDGPAYKKYMHEDSEVMTSKDKFFSVDEQTRLLGVYEECCVLALERSQIPSAFSIDPAISFKTALMKVCTSITSGWFREYAWENYSTIMALYKNMGENDYIERFNSNRALLKPYTLK